MTKIHEAQVRARTDLYMNAARQAYSRADERVNRALKDGLIIHGFAFSRPSFFIAYRAAQAVSNGHNAAHGPSGGAQH